MNLSILLPLAIATPLLVAALMVSFASVMSRGLRDAVLLVATLASAGFAFVLLQRTLGGLPIAYWLGGFIPRHGVAPGIALYVDPPAAAVLATVDALFIAATFYAWRYFKVVAEYFHVMLLILMAAMNALVMAADIFTMFVSFELMSVVSYALTAFNVEDEDALTGAFQFAILGSVASLLMMIGIALLYAQGGSLNLAEVGRALVASGSPLAAAGLAMVCGGLLFKMAAAPFHFWIADADVAAPSPVAALSSGAMTLVAAFWIMRLLGAVIGPVSPLIGLVLSHLLIASGVASAWLGGLLAVFQTNLKRLLAFSTVSHMGVVLIGMGIGGPVGFAGAILYAISQGLVKAALFLLTGVVLQQHGVLDVGALCRREGDRRGLGVLFILGGLALAGAPPFGLWLGKGLIEHALPAGGAGLLLMASLAASAVLSGGAVINAALVGFFRIGPTPNRASAPLEEEESACAGPEFDTGILADKRPRLLVLTPIALLAIAAGLPLAPNVIGHVEQMARVLIDAQGFEATLLDGHVTIVRATHMALPPVGLALLFGAGAFLIPLAWTLSSRARPAPLLIGAVAALRRAHAGLLNDYVVWMLGGFTVLLAGMLFFA